MGLLTSPTDMLQSSVFLWGLLPLIAAALGYVVPAFLLESFIRTDRGRSCLLHRPAGRVAEVQRTHSIPGTSFGQQFRTSLWIMLGPTAWLNAAISAKLLPWLIPPPYDRLPSPLQVLGQVFAMFVVGDFALYWGHRIQHTSPYLWKHCHSYHHQIQTPTPTSTAFIDSTDATLQRGLGIVLAGALVQPHPFTFAVFILLGIAENVTNHSGLDSGIVDVLTLRVPWLGRARIAHHDQHHWLSNYQGNAKNYGESFWIWDWAFGTLSHNVRVEDSKKADS